MPKNKFKLRFKRYTNVFKFDRVPSHKLKHPTQKPMNLTRQLIHSATKKGEIILDPFAGSGTTCVASKQMLRKYIGIEIEESYIDVINNRLGQKNLMEIF